MTTGSLHTARATAEKGGGAFGGIKLLLCENPLPPLPEAIAAEREALPESNYYTEDRRFVVALGEVLEELR